MRIYLFLASLQAVGLANVFFDYSNFGLVNCTLYSNSGHRCYKTVFNSKLNLALNMDRLKKKKKPESFNGN